MKSKSITLLFCTFLTGFSVFSQAVTTAALPKVLFTLSPFDSLKNAYSLSPSMLVSPSFYSCNLAFFCRQEIKFEKVTKIPFKFRLGSVQQVDYLEGKKRTNPF